MTRYKVKSPGFYNGEYYDPTGKRSVLTTEKPFNKKNPIPSWLAEMPKESEAVRKKREAQEKREADFNAGQVQQGAKDINEASFLGDGEAVAGEESSAVESI